MYLVSVNVFLLLLFAFESLNVVYDFELFSSGAIEDDRATLVS